MSATKQPNKNRKRPRSYGISKDTERLSERLVVLVDGEADKAAVEILLQKWFALCNLRWGIKVVHSGLASRGNIQKRVVQAINIHKATAILVVTDDDGRCQDYSNSQPENRLGPILLNYNFNFASAIVERGNVSYAVVVANSCYEAWLLAAAASAKGNVDGKYKGKARGEASKAYARELKKLYGEYDKIGDQPKLTRRINLDDVLELQQMVDCSPSFNKLVRVLEALTGCNIVSSAFGVKLKASNHPQSRVILEQNALFLVVNISMAS